MATKHKKNVNSKFTIIKIPLSALRCLSGYPKDKKIICEIDTKDLKVVNKPQNLDEIINTARLDYAFGKYKTFGSAKSLIKELRA